MSRERPAGVDADVVAAVRRRLDEHAATWDPVLAGSRLVDAELKELCARYLAEDDEVVVHADDPQRFDARERAALEWAHVIAWNADAASDALFERLHEHFSEAQLVELGTFMALRLGQRNWLRTLGPLDGAGR